ncbi:serine/threonine-protein kinase DCLK1-like isoform X2 [Hydractinia symbiolongicarpus]|uniref:serine/threonine-protein kinase DCLK1-like isoform X2 n=1 Tax=Hydractinia symbiolongicarpus TaxID=13093 RepID=UPI00254F7CD3|nr:serine/threonine-protein kinase DCLK1-like isoform X2 [Hydractinia symbiolongicarpus]
MDSGRSSPVNLTRSSSMRSYNTNRTSLVRRNQSMSAKQVRFYRNGDRYFGGLKLAVSMERYKEFDSLLAELSMKLNLPTGAVRFIFNADDSSMITDISQLQYGIPYVCSSSNTFRQIEGGYGKHLHAWSIIAKSKNQYNKPTVLNNIENNGIAFRVDSSRDFIKPKLVTVIRNGKPPQKKVTLLLNSKTAISLDQVLDQLSAKGSLGKVDKLYTVDGRPVKTLKDLFDDDTVFIALSANEKFPDDGIELDPNSYRITPYRELKRPSNMTVRRSNSLRGSIRRYKDENENMSISKIAKNLRSNHGVHSAKGGITKVTRPRGSSMKNPDQNKEELYPTSVFESDSSDSDCEYDVYSMFGIKKDKHSVHSAYKIGRIIGDGNFAIVRECRNRKTQKPYALKIINKSKVKGKEHMIENEILILRKITHPNIVRLHEEFETPKEIYLVMELVAGGDLFDAIVANTRFSEPESAYMIRDLASAVQYLHMLNIVHRDIKPENLLVVNRNDGRKSIKLADFGLSIEVKSPMFLVCGTPTYVAPEILDESGYGLKVDVWAIGVICYILLCGFPPFRSVNHDQEELFDKILRGDFEYLSPFWDDVSESPRDLIDRLLVVDASERFDASEVLQHFWIKKWTEPVEKIHRELSEAEEANVKNRKRLRGIALAIQADLRKNASYISQRNLSPEKEKNNPFEEITNNNVTSNPKHSRGSRKSLSDDEHVQSSDSDEDSDFGTPLRRPKPRPLSFPYTLNYNPDEECHNFRPHEFR